LLKQDKPRPHQATLAFYTSKKRAAI